jgi:ABC-type phosphate transport system substrate-binding protein
MYTKLGLSALMTVALASVAVGCGSSDNKKSSTPASTSGSAATSSTTSSSSSGSSGSSGSTAANPQLQAAVDACKQSISANPQVPANIKGDLNTICEKAGSGDANAVKDATKQVCLKIVKATVPSSAQDQATAACNAAG